MTRSIWLRVRTMLQTCSTASAPSNCTRQARATECTVSPVRVRTRDGDEIGSTRPIRRLSGYPGGSVHCSMISRKTSLVSLRDRQTVLAFA